MSDTQWPRFEVFVQETAAAPYIEAGSVHAPDPWMALLNARDVFARRPACVSMWVVRVEQIYACTAESLGNQGEGDKGLGEQESGMATAGEVAAMQVYYTACKEKPAGTVTVVGQVEAESAEMAMRKAIEEQGRGRRAWVWWVFPAKAVLASQPEDTESMYAPALEKTFRLSTDFHTVSAMRSLRKTDSQPSGPDPLAGGEGL